MTLQHARFETMHDLAAVPTPDQGASVFGRPRARITRPDPRETPPGRARVSFYQRRPTRLLPTGLW